MSIAFFDTTSLYFEGAGGPTLGQLGHSKDFRPHLKQVVLGMVLDGDDRPFASFLWPGNTADVTRLMPVVQGVAVPLVIPRQKGETQLAIKETTLKGRRYVLCRNEGRRPGRMPTDGQPFWPALTASSPMATRHWSATKASGAS